MSLSEATQLLLQAGLMGKGGEVLLLDMGEPVRIVDLARDMIRLSGADPDRIRIAFTGLRPGEKLFEEPLATGEATLPTPHPKLRIAQARPGNRDAVDQMIAWLERDRAAGEGEVRVWLKNWIPEYVPPGSPSVHIASPVAPAAAAATPAVLAPAISLLARRRR
jgi:FlaA1/EpsC-like NDP-sugar epimerase